ncbi:MAG: hypothetical protein H6706_03690 [Myxococcales bacterium]|nr:hypothetical protein [Myxococcales bacterium]
MQRTLKTLSLALGLLAVGAPALAAPKKKTERAPVSVAVQNTCAAPVKLTLNEQTFDVPAGQESPAVQVAAADAEKGYKLALTGDAPADLGLLGLEDAGRYKVKVADCRAGGADVYLENLADPPAGLSPNAAAQVRFRAREVLHQEYKAGKAGRFKTLSLGMTSYQEVPAGPLDFSFRLRAAKAGPVMAMFDKSTELKAGHNYLIESHVVGNAIFFKLEDEGFPKK